VGDANYGKAIDIWAIGCILAELYNGQPLFPGDSDLHTLKLIMETMSSTLTQKQLSAFYSNPVYEGMNVSTQKCLINIYRFHYLKEIKLINLKANSRT
jgi:cyclin-dependent kinase-like